MEVLNYLEDFNMVSVVIRLVLATFLGALIGMERASKRRPAGLRTFALVCLGSCLAMVTNQYLINYYGTGDPSRLAAQVISGIGFLGIGTIVVTGKNYVRGLTTAATLWATATLGIAVGSGFIFGALVAFILIVIIIHLLTVVSKHQEHYNRLIGLYIEMNREHGTKQLLDYVHEKKYIINTIEKKRKITLEGKDTVVIVDLDLKRRINHDIILEEFNQLEFVHYVEEIK
ncbi:MAG TPA: MgtC/SapB family protein [Lachnospiraceae bacterium]|nr:MgtC/SapB family protein [Lachnospiraceae bacterium]